MIRLIIASAVGLAMLVFVYAACIVSGRCADKEQNR